MYSQFHWMAPSSLFLIANCLCAQPQAQSPSSPESGTKQSPPDFTLVVPSIASPLHVTAELPQWAGLDVSGNWRLTELGQTDPGAKSQLVRAIGDDGTLRSERALLIADIPPRPGDRESRRFRLQASEPADGSEQRPLRFKKVSDNALAIWEGRDPVLVYNHEMITKNEVPEKDHRRRRSCYIHPLWGLNGEVLTDDFPKDHYHHHGVFWAWPHVRTDGGNYDLWTYPDMKHRFQRWLSQDDGSAAATLGVENGWFVDDKKVMVERLWLRVFRATDSARAIDVTLFLIPTEKAVTLQGAKGKSYGGLTLRFAPRRNNDTVITIPSGRTDGDLPDTRLKWADLTGTLGDSKTPSGAALFVDTAHPDYPPTWLTRHYGVLCVGWPGVTPRTLQPGQPIRLDYRIWIHKTSVDVRALQQAYLSYLTAKKITWE